MRAAPHLITRAPQPDFHHRGATRYRPIIYASGTTAQPLHVDRGHTYLQAENALDIIGQALLGTGTSYETVVRTVTYVSTCVMLPRLPRHISK